METRVGGVEDLGVDLINGDYSRTGKRNVGHRIRVIRDVTVMKIPRARKWTRQIRPSRNRIGDYLRMLRGLERECNLQETRPRH